jgi:phosphoribosyl 1,2-cyclic phosphodiesterase
LKITFYGTRGSIPVSDPEYVHFGGNTSCILITFNSGRIGILDAGTGIRRLGHDITARSIQQYDNIFVGLSHTHWDHIQGFPFFQPAYDPRRHFTISIYREDRSTKDLESIFESQMQSDYFPVTLDKMGAKLTFWQAEASDFTTPNAVNIVSSRHKHPGHAYGYRITEGKTTLVYCTDVEHGEDIDPNVIALSRNADLLIHDAQYTPEELRNKEGWGHSSWEQAVEVALRSGAKKLALFHHDPEHNDAFLLKIEKECQRLFSEAFVAREGSEVEL